MAKGKFTAEDIHKAYRRGREEERMSSKPHNVSQSENSGSSFIKRTFDAMHQQRSFIWNNLRENFTFKNSFAFFSSSLVIGWVARTTYLVISEKIAENRIKDFDESLKDTGLSSDEAISMITSDYTCDIMLKKFEESNKDKLNENEQKKLKNLKELCKDKKKFDKKISEQMVANKSATKKINAEIDESILQEKFSPIIYPIDFGKKGIYKQNYDFYGDRSFVCKLPHELKERIPYASKCNYNMVPYKNYDRITSDFKDFVEQVYKRRAQEIINKELGKENKGRT